MPRKSRKGLCFRSASNRSKAQRRLKAKVLKDSKEEGIILIHQDSNEFRRLKHQIKRRIEVETLTPQEQELIRQLRKKVIDETPETNEERCFAELLLLKAKQKLLPDRQSLMKEAIRIEINPQVPLSKENQDKNPISSSQLQKNELEWRDLLANPDDDLEIDIGDDCFNEAENKRQPYETMEEWIARVSNQDEQGMRMDQEVNSGPRKSGRRSKNTESYLTMEDYNYLSLMEPINKAVKIAQANYRKARANLENLQPDPDDIAKRTELDKLREELEIKVYTNGRQLIDKVKKELEENLKTFSQETLEERTERIKKEIGVSMQRTRKSYRGQLRDIRELPREERQAKILEINNERAKLYMAKKLVEMTEDEKEALKARRAAEARKRNKMEKEEYRIFMDLKDCPNVDNFKEIMTEERNQAAVEFWGNYSGMRLAKEVPIYRTKLFRLLTMIRESRSMSLLKEEFQNFKKFLDENEEPVLKHLTYKKSYVNTYTRYRFGKVDQIVQELGGEDAAKITKKWKPVSVTPELAEKQRLLANARLRQRYQKKKFGLDLGLGSYMKTPRTRPNKNLNAHRTAAAGNMTENPKVPPKKEGNKTSSMDKGSRKRKQAIRDANSERNFTTANSSEDFSRPNDSSSNDNGGGFDDDHWETMETFEVPLSTVHQAIDNIPTAMTHPLSLPRVEQIPNQNNSFFNPHSTCPSVHQNQTNFQLQPNSFDVNQPNQPLWNHQYQLSLQNQGPIQWNQSLQQVGNLNISSHTPSWPQCQLSGTISIPGTSLSSTIPCDSTTISLPQGPPNSLVEVEVESSESAPLSQNRNRGRPKGSTNINKAKSIKKPKPCKTVPEQRQKSTVPVPPIVPNAKIIEMGMQIENIQPKCKHCDKFFSSQERLDVHLKLKICQKISEDKCRESTSVTKEVYAGDRIWKCKLCGTGFRYKKRLINHMGNAHFEENLYVCPYCSQTKEKLFRFCRTTLVTHIKNRHRDLGLTQSYLIGFTGRRATKHTNTFTCFVCLQNFKSYSSAADHFAETHGKLKYNCEFCGIILNRLDHLKDHVKLFHPEKQIAAVSENPMEFENDFECDVCISKFTSSVFLQSHRKKGHQLIPSDKKKKTRVTKKDFECPGCDRQFHKKFSRDKHAKKCKWTLKTCSICAEAYDSQKELEEHFLEQHPTEKPVLQLQRPKFDLYKCELCFHSYADLFGLRKHYILKHNLSEYLQKIKHIIPPEQEELSTQSELTEESEIINNNKESSISEPQPSTSERAFNSATINTPSSSTLKTPAGNSHNRSAISSTTHKCAECPQTFSQMDFHKSHRIYQKLLRRYCKPCNRMLSKTGVYRIHNKFAHGITHSTDDLPHAGYDPLKEDDDQDEEEFTCGVCIEKFTPKQFHRHHSFFKKDPDLRTCKLCNKTYYGRPKAHMREFHDKISEDGKMSKELNLSAEDYKKLSASTLLSTAKGEMEIWTCKACLKNFKTEAFLHTHIAQLHSQDAFSRVLCKLCNMTFASDGNLYRHVKYIHNKNLQRTLCPLCPKTFSRIRQLRIHVSSLHKGETPDLKLAKKVPLEKVHEENKSILCELCNKGFPNQDKLKRHMTNTHFRFHFVSFCKHCGLQVAQEGMSQHVKKFHRTEPHHSNPQYVYKEKISLVKLVEMIEEITGPKIHKIPASKSKTPRKKVNPKKSRKLELESSGESEFSDSDDDSSSNESWAKSDSDSEINEGSDSDEYSLKNYIIKPQNLKRNKTKLRPRTRKITKKNPRTESSGSDEESDNSNSNYQHCLIDEGRIPVVLLENCDELYWKMKQQEESKSGASTSSKSPRNSPQKKASTSTSELDFNANDDFQNPMDYMDFIDESEEHILEPAEVKVEIEEHFSDFVSENFNITF